MSFELRDIAELAEELGGLTAAKAELKRRGIELWDGFYNHGAYQSVLVEPKATNITAKQKQYWTLSEIDGIGAIKQLSDSLGLDIVLHQFHQTNWVMLRNARGQRQQVKVYSTQRYMNRHGRAQFTVAGFLTGQAPGYYMFMCYEGPRAWVVTRKQLIGLHKECFSKTGKDIRHSIVKPTKDDPEGIRTSFSIPRHHRLKREARNEDQIKGHLSITFDPEDEFRLIKATQLGL